MSYAIIGLLFLLLVVFAFLAARDWHWVNIVFLVLIFLSGLAASIGLSQAFKNRTSAMKEANREEQRAIQSERQAAEAISGPIDAVTYSDDSLRGRTEALERELLGRGRVWASGSITPQDPNRVFQFAASRGDGQFKMEGMIVYAFADGTTEDQTVYPFAFVGTFRVIAETPEQITLEPIFIANTNLNQNPGGTWSLFEKMPIDRRDAFKKVEGIQNEDLDISAYRQIVMERLPAESLGFDLNDPVQAGEYETLVDRYTFDGLEFGQISKWIDAQIQNGQPRINAVFEATPDETFIEYTFDKATDAVFEVDATANLQEDGYFNPNGQATDPSLHAGGRIAFAEGDKVLIDQRSAEGYQRGPGITVPAFAQEYPVSETGRYFKRQLKDYPFILSNLQRETENLRNQIQRVQASTQVTDEALANANSQIAQRTEINTQLAADRDGFQRDLGLIADLLTQRTQQLEQVEREVQSLRGRIDALYRQVHGEVTRVRGRNPEQVAGR